MNKQKIVVGIAAKGTHPSAPELLRSTIEWLRERKIDFRIDSETARLGGTAPLSKLLADVAAEKIIERDKLTSICEIIVVLGGDGTLISVTRHVATMPVKIIGVNLGTLGFLTEITVEELLPVLEDTLAGRAKTQSRQLLLARVTRPGEKTISRTAINDVVVSKEALARIFAIDFFSDGQRAATIRGDGVIVSTPGGSTAYSLAAGGSIVHPEVNAILLTPICPHSLTSRPLVLPGSSKLLLRVSAEPKLRDGEVYLTIDGQEGMALSNGSEVEVSTSDHRIEMVRSPSRNYFEVLGAKLKWANQ